MKISPTFKGLVICILFAFTAISCSSSGGSDSCTPNESECVSTSSFRVCSADEAWGAPQRCPQNQTCDEGSGACVSTNPNADGDTDITKECETGQTLCAGTLIQTCSAVGTWDAPSPCLGEMTCIDGECKTGAPTACTAKESQCIDDNNFKVCKDDGSGFNEAEACPGGEVCYESKGKCLPEGTKICTPKSETRCNTNGQVEHCNSAGSGWENPEDCQNGFRCYDGRCIDESQLVCAPSVETRCKEGKLQVCNADGTDWSQPMDCPSGMTCDVDRCVEGNCEPAKDFKCTDELKIQWCNSTGDGYDDPLDCPSGLVCVRDSQAGCSSSNYICEPNQPSCKDAQNIQICNADGTDYLGGLKPCNPGVEGKRCVDGVCVGLCEMAKLSNSYIGCEYYAVTLPNGVDSAFKSGEESEFAVVVSNTNKTVAAEVTVTYTGGGFTKTVPVPPEAETTIRLPYKDHTCGSFTSAKTTCTYKDKNAFHIESTIPVTAYQFNPITAEIGGTFAHTNDASLLLPTHVLGKTYMPIAYPQSIFDVETQVSTGPVFYTIVATKDNTKVKITSKGLTEAGDGIPEMTPGQTHSATINKGEILQIASNQTNTQAHNYIKRDTCQPNPSGGTANICLGSDLAGSLIEASEPVAVFSGNECTYVPHFRSACDHLEQQIFPVSSWTTQYIAAKMEPPLQNHPNIYRIMALKDDTEIMTKPKSVLTQMSYFGERSCSGKLSAGETCMIETTENFIVISNANHPILIAQFLVGQNYNPSQTTKEGDPAFVLVPPVEQYRYDYVFLIPGTYETDKLTLLSTTNNAEIFLDGNKLNTNFSQIGGLNAYMMHMDIADGRHTLRSNKRLGVMVYGYDSYVSYAYPAGLDLTYTPY